MNFPRLLTLVFAAALTAGTSSATSILFDLYVGSPSQVVSLSINGSPVNDIYSSGTTFQGSDDLADGWNAISIDYIATSGNNHLALSLNNNGSPAQNYFAAYNTVGTASFGLEGDYYVGGVFDFTKYGEGPIYDGLVTSTEYYNGAPGLWAGTFTSTSQFEEKLSGYIYIGAGTPSLSTLPADQQQQGGSGTAPEPDNWWLIAGALPLLVLSRLRSKTAKARK